MMVLTRALLIREVIEIREWDVFALFEVAVKCGGTMVMAVMDTLQFPLIF